MGSSVWLKTKPSLWCWTALYTRCPGDPPVLDAARRTKIWAIYMDEESWPEFHRICRAWVSQCALDMQGELCYSTKMSTCCMVPSAFLTSAYLICPCRPAGRKESEEIRSGTGEIILKKGNI